MEPYGSISTIHRCLRVLFEGSHQYDPLQAHVIVQFVYVGV